MVNYKKKAGKKTKTASHSITGEKPSASSTPSSTVSDHDRMPVVTSLPPAVDGHLRCFLRVSIPTIHWTIPKYPMDVQVRLRWWGEDGDGVLFRPLDDRAADQVKHSPRLTCVRYAVCSGPRQFHAYLQDMGALIFELVHGPLLMLLGQVRLFDTMQLSASAPIQGFFDVMSASAPGEKLALLYIAIKFESLSVAYSELSSSIPTIDMKIDPEREPLSLKPAAPVIYPRQNTLAMDPFVSLGMKIEGDKTGIHNLHVGTDEEDKGVKFAPTSPERPEYATENSQVLTPTTDKKEMEKGEDEVIASSELTSVSSPNHEYGAAYIPSDLIGALLHRGEKLREAMVMSADEDNNIEEPDGVHTITKGTSPPGKLLKAILTSDEPGVDESVVIESVLSHNKKAVDLVVGEEEMHYLEESCHSSPESSIVSESGDPLYDETLLKDLFYTASAKQSETDSENTVITDDEESVANTLQDEKYNKVSFKIRQNHRSARTMSKKSSSRKDKIINHAEKSENNLITDDSSEMARMKYLDPNSTENATEHPRGKQSPSHNLSDLIPSATNSQMLNPKSHALIENLGPEKLTALGRVDAARVMVDSLGITGQNAKLGTYFVEYDFPTSTPSQNEEKDINIATELTRIASKNIQDGSELF